MSSTIASHFLAIYKILYTKSLHDGLPPTRDLAPHAHTLLL